MVGNSNETQQLCMHMPSFLTRLTWHSDMLRLLDLTKVRA